MRDSSFSLTLSSLPPLCLGPFLLMLSSWRGSIFSCLPACARACVLRFRPWPLCFFKSLWGLGASERKFLLSKIYRCIKGDGRSVEKYRYRKWKRSQQRLWNNRPWMIQLHLMQMSFGSFSSWTFLSLFFFHPYSLQQLLPVFKCEDVCKCCVCSVSTSSALKNVFSFAKLSK